jgi:hypothetical protein
MTCYSGSPTKRLLQVTGMDSGGRIHAPANIGFDFTANGRRLNQEPPSRFAPNSLLFHSDCLGLNPALCEGWYALRIYSVPHFCLRIMVLVQHGPTVFLRCQQVGRQPSIQSSFCRWGCQSNDISLRSLSAQVLFRLGIRKHSLCVSFGSNEAIG